VVHKSPLAVDLDDREPFAVESLKLRIAADIDLLELETEFGLSLTEDPLGRLTEMTALRAIQDDSQRVSS
jgi:hypothetical protein